MDVSSNMQTAENVKHIRSSYIREILSAATNEGVISLAGGLPAKDLLPHQLLQQAMVEVSKNREVFQYGETQGHRGLLEYLTQSYGLNPEQSILVTTGSQQGLDLIARTFINPGDNVVLEAPSYLGALQVFSLARANIHTVQQVENGPDLIALKALFESRTVKFFYAVPDFHNPTGICWSQETRLSVAKLCREFNVVLIEDAPYRELRFSGKAVPLVSSFCPECSIVLRSASKVSAPGLRLGFVTGPEQWISDLAKIKQVADLHSCLPMQAVLLELYRHPEYRVYLQNVRNHYLQRYSTLADAIRCYLPSDVSFSEVEGGMFLWLRLAHGNPMDIAKLALNNGVAVVPGDVFYTNENNFLPALRLNFSYCTPDKLKVAMKILAKII